MANANNTDTEDVTHPRKAHGTGLDAGLCRDQETGHSAHWKTVTKTPHGTFKEMKLGPQHYPIHQWKLAGREKKEMLGKEAREPRVLGRRSLSGSWSSR